MTFVLSRRPQSTPAWRPQPAARALFSLVVLGLLAWPRAAPARAQQTMTVRRDGEAFLGVPGGKLLGRLAAGAAIATQGSRGGNTQVTLEGWMLRTSVRAANRNGHNLAVSRFGNLRAAPNGRLVARLVLGALLDQVEQRGAWVHVRRSGWVPGGALASAPAAAAAAPTAAANQPDTGAAVETSVDARRAVLRRQVRLYRAPDAPATGVLEAGVPIRITARAGGWVRVEAAGWVRESEVRQAGGQAVSGVTAAELRSSPDEWKGKVLRWTIQYIALQTADELRPDLAPGQRYILARGPAPEYAFVYVIVPPEQVEAIARLQPLDSITILARVKRGRSAYLANPILELLDVVP
jgi:hypothetical protein